MATGSNIKTYFDGAWHDGDVPIMRAADHGAWLGTTVFDGARHVDGLAPDLMAHCERVNRSAAALMLTPTHTAQEIFDITWDGLKRYPKGTPVYIRPMYWGLDGGHMGIVPKENATGFAICLEEIPMAAPEAASRLTTTQFHRPVLADNVTNAKAGCLYPNNARMLAEAASKGYDNALVADALGNVAETATANIFMVQDGVVFTPVANGTFLSGITRARHIRNLRADGYDVREEVLGFDRFREADEVFMSGNLNKVTPVTEFDGTHYQIGPVTRKARELYWDWAQSADA
ncbi:branched-chain amino acid aminotransferase [Rhodophyticola porphyridii]|uniref:Probable branched-chain-amino-acid aminotransferase n=1 Tax=Rhodophyticola porphyridii TaxID=1852017 RepID=A0A3L9Y4Q6_9RHOB|nr:branched-chain amino acid aminotransferase [Rhodophyticola porphyridii]RMA43804.1 branched-chain amino acid aminotransferase [Rhodophyticola porphyridii]